MAANYLLWACTVLSDAVEHHVLHDRPRDVDRVGARGAVPMRGTRIVFPVAHHNARATHFTSEESRKQVLAGLATPTPASSPCWRSPLHHSCPRTQTLPTLSRPHFNIRAELEIPNCALIQGGLVLKEDDLSERLSAGLNSDVYLRH